MSIPIPKTFLLVDAMYFHAALQNYHRALGFLEGIEQAEDRVLELESSIETLQEIASNEGWKPNSYDKFAKLAIKMESEEYEIGMAYGPYLQALATTHILCVASLESHINIKANVLLDGKTRDFFERISLEAKWLFLPRLIGASTFSPGKQPYQSFAKLVSYRNKLVHYKTRGEDWKTKDSITPSFLKILGLTKEAANVSLSSVRSMIKNLSLKLNEEIPYWLRVEDISYFGFRILSD